MSTTHHVILVRPWDQQMSGSGCCGRLGGASSDIGSDDRDFAPQREDMECVGEVYRALRQVLPEGVELTVADPRNNIWLVPQLIRQGWARGYRGRTLLREIGRGTSTRAVIVDGHAVAWGWLPEASEVVDLVLIDLQGPRPPVTT